MPRSCDGVMAACEINRAEASLDFVGLLLFDRDAVHKLGDCFELASTMLATLRRDNAHPKHKQRRSKNGEKTKNQKKGKR